MWSLKEFITTGKAWWLEGEVTGHSTSSVEKLGTVKVEFSCLSPSYSDTDPNPRDSTTHIRVDLPISVNPV